MNKPTNEIEDRARKLDLRSRTDEALREAEWEIEDSLRTFANADLEVTYSAVVAEIDRRSSL